MSTEETTLPKRRSSAANRRRRRTEGAGTAPVAQEAVQESTVVKTDEAVKVERHVQRREDRKAAKSQKEQKGVVAKVVDAERFSGIKKFYYETMSEIRKVIWPDREQTRNLTLVVVGMSVAMGTLLGGIDWALLKLFEIIG